MAANIFFGVVVLVLMIAMLQGFFILLAIYPQVAFGIVVFVSCLSLYYDYRVGSSK